MYAGGHMIGALKVSLWITSLGLAADIVGAVFLLWWGPILNYRRARRGDPAADPSMQENAADARRGLLLLIGGVRSSAARRLALRVWTIGRNP